MFTVYSAIEVEDLYYAIVTRIQVVTRMLGEAQDKMRGTLAEDFQHELDRLSILEHNLKRHIEDHDYRFDVLYELFPEE